MTLLVKKHLLLIILISVVSAVVYSNSLDNSFQYDDAFNIVGNTLIKSLENIPGFFTSPISSSIPRWKSGYRPLLMTSFTINYKLGGLKTRGYHVVNILFHVINAALVYLLVFIILGLNEKKGEMPGNSNVKFIMSLFVALLFAVHPINTEAVNYIWQRSVLMSACFYLSAIVFLMNHLKRNRTWMFILSLVFYVMALLSKEIAITLPLIIILIDLYFISGFDRERFIRQFKKCHSSFLFISLVYLLMRFFSHGVIKDFSSPDKEGMLNYFMTQFGVIIQYLKLIVFPRGLSVYHVFPVAEGIVDVRVLFSIAVILLFILVGIRLVRISKTASLFILWFFIVLLPTSSILPLRIIMNEHRLYLPGIGIYAAFIILLFKLIPTRFHKKILPVLLSIIIIVFSLLTINRNTDWKDEYTLWSKTIKQYPDNSHAHNYLGMGLFDKGLIDRAIDSFKKSLEYNPDSSFTRGNLGSAYATRGLLDNAIVEYEEAIRLNPAKYDAYSNLGSVYLLKKSYDRAVELYKKAISLNSSHIDSYSYLGLTYSKKGMYKEARETFENALKIDPRSSDIINKLRSLPQ